MRCFLPLLLLVGCSDSSQIDYWTGAGPTITSHAPASADSLLGGETLKIQGSGLATVQTVVIGGRNAEIVCSCDEEVEVILPKGTPGGGPVDITVVTNYGQATMEECFEYASPGADLWADEVASISLYQVHCPIDLMTEDEEGTPWMNLFWCGFEGGYADAYGFDGASPQPGFAGDLMGFAGISTLPALGESHVVPPGERVQPAPPLIYGVHPDDEAFHVVAERDFARDMENLGAQIDIIESTYSWASDITEYRTQTWLYGEDECLSDSLEVLEYDWNRLTLEDSASGATGIHLGLEVDEDWFGEIYTNDVPLASAKVCAFGDEVEAEDSGVVLRYDGWSGYFFADTVGGTLLPSDLPTSARYKISHSRLGETSELGVVRGVEGLELIYPPLMTGNLQPSSGSGSSLVVHDISHLQKYLGLDGSLTIEWEPGEDSDEGTFISVELVYYDSSLDDPYWMTEIGRVIAHGDDAEGAVTLPVDQLLALPEAPNLVDSNYDLTGVWAELSVARHQLRVLNLDEGDMVVDFVDVYNGPITIYHPE